MAKKTDSDPITPDAPADVAVLQSRMDQMLDLLAEQSEELANLKTAQTGKAAVAVKQNDVEAVFDAEHAALLEEFKDYALIETFARRAIEGVDANMDIRLVGEPPLGSEGVRIWKLRWFNFAKDGRAQRATAEGYEKVRWVDLQDQESIGVSVRTDEFVRKGDRGLEVLCRIPLKLYDYKKRRDAAKMNGLLTSESRLKHHIANTVAGRAGAMGDNADQAGTFADKRMSMTINAGGPYVDDTGRLVPGGPERFAP